MLIELSIVVAINDAGRGSSWASARGTLKIIAAGRGAGTPWRYNLFGNGSSRPSNLQC